MVAVACRYLGKLIVKYMKSIRRDDILNYAVHTISLKIGKLKNICTLVPESEFAY